MATSTPAPPAPARLAAGDILAPAPRWRDRLLPRSVLGMSSLILAAAVGAAFSGTVLYAYYEYRVTKTEHRIAQFESRFSKNFDTAIATIKAERDNAKAAIQKELEPLRKVQAPGAVLEGLIKQVQPSVYFVHTLDEAGQPSVGSAFVVASNSEQSVLLTSYATVRASARRPGPAIAIRKGAEDITATLHTWQEDKDLAVLVVSKAGLPKLSFAPASPALRIGDQIFVVSGLGGAGGAISQGFIADVSAVGIQHDAPVGPAFQGGPLLSSKGEVVGVASRAFAPLGFASDAVFFGVRISDACDRVLRCPSGEVTGTGPAR